MVGRIIKKERKKQNLKIYELAHKIKVVPVYITQIEKHNKLPSIEIMIKIIKTLKMGKKEILSMFFKEKYPYFYKIFNKYCN